MFAKRLIELLRDLSLRRRMGCAGRAAILERFHHETVVSELASMLRALCRPREHSDA
jgi:hypothetical protein